MLLPPLCTVVVRATLPAVSHHLEMQAELPLDPTCSLYHILSVMHEMRGRKMDAASPHSQSHLGPWMSPYLQCSLQVTPGVMQRHSPTPWRKWVIGFPERMSAPANACFSSELQCLSKSGWHLKDLGLWLSGLGWSGLWESWGLGTDFALAGGAMGQPLSLGLPGRAIAADQPTESEV